LEDLYNLEEERTEGTMHQFFDEETSIKQYTVATPRYANSDDEWFDFWYNTEGEFEDEELDEPVVPAFIN
jgi:hypothetical protein